jgi:hypothetical protein
MRVFSMETDFVSLERKRRTLTDEFLHFVVTIFREYGLTLRCVWFRSEEECDDSIPYFKDRMVPWSCLVGSLERFLFLVWMEGWKQIG